MMEESSPSLQRFFFLPHWSEMRRHFLQASLRVCTFLPAQLSPAQPPSSLPASVTTPPAPPPVPSAFPPSPSLAVSPAVLILMGLSLLPADITIFLFFFSFPSALLLCCVWEVSRLVVWISGVVAAHVEKSDVCFSKCSASLSVPLCCTWAAGHLMLVTAD